MIGVCVVLALIGRGATQSWLHPFSIWFTTWAFVASSYASAGPSLYQMSWQTFQFAMIGLLAVGAGIFVAAVFQTSINGTRQIPDTNTHEFRLDPKRLKKVYLLLNIALAGYVGLQVQSLLPVLRSSGGLSAILGGDSALNFRRAYLSQRLADVQSDLGGGNLLRALLGYLLFVGLLALPLAGYYASVGRWKVAWPPILLTAGYSLLILERASFIYGFAIFFFSFVYCRSLVGKTKLGKTSWKPAAAMVVLVLAVAVVPAALRATGSSSDPNGQGSVFSYVYAGLAGLNGAVRIDEDLSSAYTGEGSPVLARRSVRAVQLGDGRGVWTFQGLSTIAERLGLDLSTPSQGLSYARTGPPLGAIANVYSFVIYLWYDGRLWGVVAGGLLLGAVSQMFHRRVQKMRRFEFLAVAALLMTTLAMSFFGLALLRDPRYLFMAAASVPILRRLQMTSVKKADPDRRLNTSAPTPSDAQALAERLP